MAHLEIKALLFDVFGTVVDWRGSITQEMQRFAMSIRSIKTGNNLLSIGVRFISRPWKVFALAKEAM